MQDRLPLNGVYAAAATPMHENFSCNHEALADHCRDLMGRGCKGIVLFGTTGEGSAFSVREREEVVKELIKRGFDSQRLILGIIDCAIENVVKLTSFSVSQRCAATLIVPPSYFKNIDDDGVIAFYRTVIHEVNHPDLRILLYHIPQLSGVPITMNIIKTLVSEFPNQIIGIKESEGNLAFSKQILSTFPTLKIFVGNELQISEIVRLGGAGGISGLANAYPESICALYDAANKQQNNVNESPFVKHVIELIQKYPLFPALKCLVEIQKGNAWHVMRPPLMPLSNSQRDALAQRLSLK